MKLPTLITCACLTTMRSVSSCAFRCVSLPVNDVFSADVRRHSIYLPSQSAPAKHLTIRETFFKSIVYQGAAQRGLKRSSGNKIIFRRVIPGAMAGLQGTDGGSSATLSGAQSAAVSGAVVVDQRRIKFCSQCGSSTVFEIPEGDERGRDVCSSPSCRVVHYSNPKLVVGALCLWEGKVLLCQRAIEPCRGKWGIPQGYMELGESAREGAAREVLEEAGAEAALGPLLAVYNVPNEVQLLFLGRLTSPRFASGVESLDVGLFTWEEIERLDLAFPTVRWALDYAKMVIGGPSEFSPQQRAKVIGTGRPYSGTYIDEWKQEGNSRLSSL
eukprot:TRINITY_DN1623_c0_g2_i1.p1 TRINITY_DN1623_c0_g2~~TRINITY_DN1623_c0_g2_i1.p1  ORF type:complete len:328 (+),score=42.86 TRINITY_DN1623_c0_g2_i1:1-984(+)